MPFRYYARLSRAQQATYRKSDAVTEIRLHRPAELHPLVSALAAALESEDRPATEAATARLVRGLTDAMGIAPVKVEVLAARPHAGWGELHGLYTAVRGERAKIQLWMRTAKQKRVVAFRTYLRTLLHELGHHADYQLLRLRDSFHTEGFYKRESSLFHQLVPGKDIGMPTIEEYAAAPVEKKLARLGRTADELAATIQGQPEAVLSRRPDAKNWAAKEVICHLRDTEESFMARFEAMLAMTDPRFTGVNPDRWAEERQYLRNDAAQALAAFRARRHDTLEFFRRMKGDDWQRAGIHAVRGRMTIADFLNMMAWHDDNHLDQIRRALEGRA